MSAITPPPFASRSLPRLEAREKVTGRIDYTHHVKLPGMIYGKIFRTTMPHSKIISVDTSAAAALPGVYQVVTIED
ncbi:MAG: aerobic-type carbon monoxide dehydrogenase, large subunit CoxL/CutL-like protein, partial [Hyphomicrobiales bacterium]|nr:aerobic-type carbon monoxide dehydrogenase, large subunit CoxL/CutL-like protein [Hyphomicrobiales bacterium]